MTTDLGRVVHLLRNTPVQKLIKALERDGFSLERTTPTGSHIYKHPHGRMTVVHFHHKSDTLTRKTLRSLVEAVNWTQEDLVRLKLIKSI